MKEIILSYLSMLFYEIAAFFAFQKLSNKKINMKNLVLKIIIIM